MKNGIDFLMKIALIVQRAVSNKDNLTILILPTHEHRKPFVVVVSSISSVWL